MNKKRTLLTVVALILVCVLSVMGTLAFLKSTTNTVTNTFVAAGGPGPFIDDDPNSEDPKDVLFAIKEYEVDVTSAGKYYFVNYAEEGAQEPVYKEIDGGYKYDTVMPGITLPKQAFVKLSRTSGSKTETVEGVEVTTEIKPAPAYLYLEVVDGLPEAYKWEIDESNWKLLDGVTGVNNGKVYLYIGSLADANNVITNIAAYSSNQINIIKNNKVTVDDNAELTADPVTLSFNAYLSQASTGETDDPAAVFNACFK